MGKFIPYPVIDLQATGKNIKHLRESRGLSVKELQEYFGFDFPQAIYQWERGITLPSVDNLFALSKKLEVSMEEILVQCPPRGTGPEGQAMERPKRSWNTMFGLILT